jgi:hypothetical protein
MPPGIHTGYEDVAINEGVANSGSSIAIERCGDKVRLRSETRRLSFPLPLSSSYHAIVALCLP